jgi:hypothetical protein
MRWVVGLSVLVIAALVVDEFQYKGRYRQDVVREAQYEGQKLSYEIRRYVDPFFGR